jgi:hypothetical protein
MPVDWPLVFINKVLLVVGKIKTKSSKDHT